MQTRPTVIAGNWKMHKTIAEALEFLRELTPLIASAQAKVCLAVPFTCLSSVAREGSGHKLFHIGAQNASSHIEGAWTGEISSHMLKEAGGDFVILGHSERRQYFAESSQLVAQKLRLAIEAGLEAIVCFGESLQEREAGQEKIVTEIQIRESLAAFPLELTRHLCLAYEPVWAIGTGKNASPGVAQEMHLHCRNVLEKMWDKPTAANIPILYGGSVKPENTPQLLAQPDVDGLLVGGASLDARTFSEIVNATVNQQVM